MRIYTEPKVTLLGQMTFNNPLAGEWETDAEGGEALAEFAGRLCFLSFGEDSSIGAGHKTIKGRTGNGPYLDNIKKQRHGSVTEHANYSILIEQVSRSLTHELVRHRAGFAYSQLSQRYVDESEVAFVKPPTLEGFEAQEFETACTFALQSYCRILDSVMERLKDSDLPETIKKKRARESARSVLPNSTETKIVVTGNVRAFRHMLEMRGSAGADREIRAMAVMVGKLLKSEAPNFFADMEVIVDTDGIESLRFDYSKI